LAVPVPIVKRGDKWSFDAKAGRQELLYRRIGANELTPFKFHGYVEAQHDTLFNPMSGYDVNQYASASLARPGKQEWPAWQTTRAPGRSDRRKKLPARIEQGYTSPPSRTTAISSRFSKGKDPSAVGEMDFLVKGVMIGGFALIAAPAEYSVTGVRAFIVSHDGVVYERDLGPKTLEEFGKMERFNPEKSWTPVAEKTSKRRFARLCRPSVRGSVLYRSAKDADSPSIHAGFSVRGA